MYVSAEDLRKHLNLDTDEDDGYITELEQVAEDYISEFIGRPLKDFETEGVMAKSQIRHAIRLLVGHWYSSREIVTYGNAQTLPFGFMSLLQPLKQYGRER